MDAEGLEGDLVASGVAGELGVDGDGRHSGLLTVGVFLVLFIGSGVVLKDFYAMPAIVAFVIALLVAFCQRPRRSFERKLTDATWSMGDFHVMVMCLALVLAGGAYTGAAEGAGRRPLSLADGDLPARPRSIATKAAVCGLSRAGRSSVRRGVRAHEAASWAFARMGIGESDRPPSSRDRKRAKS